MSIPKKYEDVGWCGNCIKDTDQLFYDSGDERDSSNDWRECLECGYIRYGFSDEWTAPRNPNDLDWEEEDGDELFNDKK